MQYVLMGLFVLTIVILVRSVKIVPQKQVKIIERLGKFHSQADAGLNIILPFFDTVRATHDLRERITKIEPQPVITRDNVTMEVDAVIYYLLIDPIRATYEVQNLEWGIEQLTLSALRNVIGSLDLDHTLTSRDAINTQLRAALDSATQQWGVKVVRILRNGLVRDAERVIQRVVLVVTIGHDLPPPLAEASGVPFLQATAAIARSHLCSFVNSIAMGDCSTSGTTPTTQDDWASGVYLALQSRPH